MDLCQMSQLLEPYLDRLIVRRGNGLSKNMNQSLRSYPIIPDIIRRTYIHLAQGEQMLNYNWVFVPTMMLYRNLVAEHDDWGYDVPVVRKLSPSQVISTIEEVGTDVLGQIPPEDHFIFAGTVEFERRAILPYNQFVAAMTIGRRIGLLAGHGRVGLTEDIRNVLRARAQSAA